MKHEFARAIRFRVLSRGLGVPFYPSGSFPPDNEFPRTRSGRKGINIFLFRGVPLDLITLAKT